MYYILRFLQRACSVIKFVILTIVCRSKSASELMLHCYVYSTINKSSMSMKKKWKLQFSDRQGKHTCSQWSDLAEIRTHPRYFAD